MKYYYEKPERWSGAGETYICDHVLFNRCTLIKRGGKGIILIQERYNEKTKARWWGTVDPWLSYDICAHENFPKFFNENASSPDENGIYPIFPVRKIMWSLRMKPLRQEKWEISPDKLCLSDR